jgi:hypothetical protein
MPDNDRVFAYTYEASGAILETNGTRAGVRKVIWRFEESELFPHGKRMWARSIRRRPQNEKKLYGRELFDKRNLLLEVHSVLVDDPALVEAVRGAVRQSSKAPIRALAESSEDPCQVERAEFMLKLAEDKLEKP